MARRVVLFNLAPETNAGDLVLQDGLLRLMGSRSIQRPVPTVVLVGPNQAERLAIDYPALSARPDVEVFFLPRPTFFNQGAGLRRILGELANACSVGLGILLVVTARVSPGLAERLLPGRYRQTVQALRDADLVVWKGTNLRGRRNKLLQFYRILARAYVPLLVAALGKRMVCVNLSVWKIDGTLSRALARRMLSACLEITVRESESLANAIDLLGTASSTEVMLAPDLSLALLTDAPVREAPPALGGLGMRVSVTLVDWKEFGLAARARYAGGIGSFLTSLIERFDSRVDIVPQVTKPWEGNSVVVQAVLDAMPPDARGRVTVIDHPMDTAELLDQYRASDLLVATRMHSAIFALAVGTPVIAIPYDTGGKWQILRDIGAGDFVVDYDRVTADALWEQFELLVASGQNAMARIRSRLEEQCARAATTLPTIVGGETGAESP